MATTKRRVSLSLDADLVAELGAAGEPLSSQVNEAVRLEVEKRRRHRLLGDALDAHEAARRPVDEELVRKYTALLG